MGKTEKNEMKRMKINVNQIVLCVESLFVTDILLLKIRKLFIHNLDY